LQLLSASLLSSSLSFWLPWIYSPFPFFMEFCNGLQLQLIECIESTRSEVKRKMIVCATRNVGPKSFRSLAAEENRAVVAPMTGDKEKARVSHFDFDRAMRGPTHRVRRDVRQASDIYNEDRFANEDRFGADRPVKERSDGWFE